MADISQAPSEQAGGTGTGAAASARLELHVESPAPSVQVVRVVGEVDLLTGPQLARCLADELARHPTHLIVDLAGVGHLGSSGLQVLVETRTAAEDGGCRLWLTGAAGPMVRRPLEWTGLLPLFSCRDTVDHTLSELR